MAAEVIEFYIPTKHKPKRRPAWIAPANRRVIEFKKQEPKGILWKYIAQ
jgi:hypothetical protein